MINQAQTVTIGTKRASIVTRAGHIIVMPIEAYYEQVNLEQKDLLERAIQKQKEALCVTQWREMYEEASLHNANLTFELSQLHEAENNGFMEPCTEDELNQIEFDRDWSGFWHF